MYAYCDNSGVIKIAASVPEGMTPIIKHNNKRQLSEAVDIMAVHGWEKNTRIVPNWNTAELMGGTQKAALETFREYLKLRLQ